MYPCRYSKQSQLTLRTTNDVGHMYVITSLVRVDNDEKGMFSQAYAAPRYPLFVSYNKYVSEIKA